MYRIVTVSRAQYRFEINEQPVCLYTHPPSQFVPLGTKTVFLLPCRCARCHIETKPGRCQVACGAGCVSLRSRALRGVCCGDMLSRAVRGVARLSDEPKTLLLSYARATEASWEITKARRPRPKPAPVAAFYQRTVSESLC